MHIVNGTSNSIRFLFVQNGHLFRLFRYFRSFRYFRYFRCSVISAVPLFLLFRCFRCSRCSRCSAVPQLEVETESDAQSHLGTIGEVVEGHVVVNGGFEGEVVVEEEGIADFGREEEVVVLPVGLLRVGVLESAGEVDSVLLDVVASCEVHGDLVPVWLVGVVDSGVEHTVVADEQARTEADVEVDLLVLAVAEAESGERSVDVLGASFKLSAGGEGHGRKGDACEELFEHGVEI